MRKKIKTTELEPGMYVDLSGQWMKHNFLKNKFIINSRAQIDELIKIGIKEIDIHTDRGIKSINDLESVSHGSATKDQKVEVPGPPPKDWDPEKIVPPEFADTILRLFADSFESLTCIETIQFPPMIRQMGLNQTLG